MTRAAALRTWLSRNKVAVQLNALSIASSIAIAVLAVLAVHFATQTEQSANSLYQSSVIRLRDLTRLEILFEHQRRLVQSAPANFDRQRLQRNQQATIETIAAMEKLAARLTENGSSTDYALYNTLSYTLPELERAATKVFMLAHNFAQERAQEVVQGDYEGAASHIEDSLRSWRETQLFATDLKLAGLRDAARSMTVWIEVLAGAACVLIGPFSLLVMFRILRRFGRVSAAMRRLAASDTTVAIPYQASRDEVGEIARAMAVFKSNALALQTAHLHLDAAVNNMVQGLCLFSKDEKLLFYNARYQEIYGLSSEHVRPGMSLRELFDQLDAIRRDPSMTAQALYDDYCSERARTGHRTYQRRFSDGRTIAVSQRNMPDGSWVDTHEDITQRVEAERKVEQLALYDSLTGLPNRVQLHRRLDDMLKHGAGAFAVICLDLDGFKNVNDTLGHSEGDKLLGQVAQRLSACTRDKAFVCRLGGDEFALLKENANDEDATAALTSEIIAALSRPYAIEGQQIVIGVSAGIAVHPRHGVTSEQLLKAADIAMYSAKAAGRGTFHMFEPAMDEKLRAKRALEADLRTALDLQQFELHYQPLIDLASDKVCGFEALLRWHHPERGWVSPGEFIPVAEEIGLIVPLGEWVLRRACLEAATWPTAMRVAVNLSAVQFHNAGLEQTVFSALARARLDAQRLELEITESILLRDSEAVLDTLRKIKDYGVKIAMDDFGTGYSSLSYLHSFPFDKIKIDKSFVRNIEAPSTLSIIRAVVNLGSSLGMTTLAEGVETESQLAVLRAEKCDQVQGFLFSAAVPAKRLKEMLRTARPFEARAAKLVPSAVAS